MKMVQSASQINIEPDEDEPFAIQTHKTDTFAATVWNGYGEKKGGGGERQDVNRSWVKEFVVGIGLSDRHTGLDVQ